MVPAGHVTHRTVPDFAASYCAADHLRVCDLRCFWPGGDLVYASILSLGRGDFLPTLYPCQCETRGSFP